MKAKKIMLVAALLVAGLTANAQTHFGIRLGGVSPMGEFGESKVTKSDGIDRWILEDDETGKYGGAAFGLNAGALLKFDVPSVPGLGIVASFDIIFNGIDGDIKDDFEDWQDDYEKTSGNEMEYTLPKYLNFPLMVGANYTYPVSSTVGIFGEAAIGLNFRKITNYHMERSSKTTASEITVKYDFASSFAFRIGAGVIFNDKYSIELDYYALGSSKIKASWESEDTYTSSNGKRDYESHSDNFKGKKLSQNMLMIRFGIMF